jgi:hypothetical protein
MPDSTPSNLPPIAVKIANGVFVLGVVLSLFISAYAAYLVIVYFDNNWREETFYTASIAVGLVSAIGFSFGLRTKGNIKVNLSLVFVSVGITLYAFETYLMVTSESTRGQTIAKQMGVPYDPRTKIQVLEDLNDSGIEAYPNSFLPYLHPNGLKTIGGNIFPLGAISNTTAVYCNESGFWTIFETDEFGFNNPKGLYTNDIDVILAGDSFTEGACVKPDENIGAVLRQLGFKTINIGRGASGPFEELASLKEYAEPLKPKVVLWMYYSNDEQDVKRSLNSFLGKYLYEGDFSQNLFIRQDEIDSLLKNLVRAKTWDSGWNSRSYTKLRTAMNGLTAVWQLPILRSKINLKQAARPDPPPSISLTEQELVLFDKILAKSKQMVSGWGGSFYFIYLPPFTRYLTGNEHLLRKFILRTATELEIPIIDMHREVFEPHPDPFSLFPFRVSNHYNAEGYRLVAEAIADRLRADGVLQ